MERVGDRDRVGGISWVRRMVGDNCVPDAVKERFAKKGKLIVRLLLFLCCLLSLFFLLTSFCITYSGWPTIKMEVADKDTKIRALFVQIMREVFVN